jgi:glutaredoxin
VEKEAVPDHIALTKRHLATTGIEFLKRIRKMKAVVWSKNQCPYCDQAKALLKMKNIEFEERNINKDFTREQLMEAVPTARTVPQIFLDDKLIGGFTELKKHFEKE